MGRLSRIVESIVRAVSNSLGFQVVILSLYEKTANVFERRAAVGLEFRGSEAPPERVPREEIARWFSERYRISKSYFVSHLDHEPSMLSTGKIERTHPRASR